MRALLIASLLLLAACAEPKPLVLGEETYPPFGYTWMCLENPEAFGCPKR